MNIDAKGHGSAATRRWTLPASALFAALLALTGCNILGPISYLAHGTGQVDAEHAIADRPTVVFVDDRENVVSPTMFRRVIAEKISEELMARKLVTRTISPHDAMALAARRDTSKEVMPIDAIGRAVGAEQVIYIEMVQFSDHQDGYNPRPIGSCRVRVIDVANRQRLYPSPDAEQPFRSITVMPREVDPELYRTRATRSQIGQMLANEMGDHIARLFYKHEPREVGRSLNPR